MNNILEITQLSQLDPNGIYSYADYLMWKFSERVELIKGAILKMAAPNRLHQKISQRINSSISIQLLNRKCELYYAPTDVRLLNPSLSTPEREVYTVVQPDLFVVCDLQKLDDRGCVGAPELIIEIISASNKKHDIDTKFHLYEEAGVLEYWIVFPNEKVVNVFDLDKTTQKYVFRKIYSDDEAIPSSVLAGLEVDLNKVFADIA